VKNRQKKTTTCYFVLIVLLLSSSSNYLRKFQLLWEEIAEIIQVECSILEYINIKKNKQFDNLASKLSSTVRRTFEAISSC